MKVDDVLRIVPALEAVRPLVRALAAASEPDPTDLWTGSSELATYGQRTVRASGLETLEAVADREGARHRALLGGVAEAIGRAVSGDSRGAARRLLDAAGAEEAVGGWRAARACAHAALEAARAADDAKLSAAAQRMAARAARAAGDLADAALRYEIAARDAEDAGDPDLAAAATMGRGNVAVDRGRWDEADLWYDRTAARIEEALEPTPLRWQLAQNRGIVARERGDPTEARRQLEEAERLSAALDAPEARVEVNNGWGQLHMATGEPEAAEIRYRRALAAAESALARTVVRVNLAECLLARGRTLEAGERAREAESIALLEGVGSRLPEVYRLLGAVAAQGGAEDAFVFWERALEAGREFGVPAHEEALTLEAYGRWRAEHGEPEEASRLLRQAAERLTAAGMDERAGRLRRLADSLDPRRTTDDGES